jgi:hypothetical protein
MEVTIEHLQAHSDQYWDGLFHDPFIVTFAGLIECQLDMSDSACFVCPFLGDGCKFRTRSLSELGIHLDQHLSEHKINLNFLSVF